MAEKIRKAQVAEKNNVLISAGLQPNRDENIS